MLCCLPKPLANESMFLLSYFNAYGRWPMKDYWARLLDGAAPIRLYEKPGADYNMLNLENFIFVQAGGSIYTYLECYGTERFLEELHSRRKPLNPKHVRLLAQYKKT